jgi:oligopeptide/dipeptide ABC transporter ATP-binding protein
MLLDVEDLRVCFGPAEPLDGVSFTLSEGEVLGIVGESGSGKSVTALAVLGLIRLQGGRITAGRVVFEGVDLARLPEAELRARRGRHIALVTQNPMTALDPVYRVGDQVAEVARRHLGLAAAAARARAIDLMAQMRIPNPAAVYEQYPHQLSGGLRQRVVIAMALAGEPRLILADEPTTALDVTVQAQIVTLLHEMTRQRRIGLVLITHDIGLVAQICDRVAVMYAGRVVESGVVASVLTAPRHPYTRALIACVPQSGMVRGTLGAIPGTVPTVASYPAGCRFHPRCPQAMPVCAERAPADLAVVEGGSVACHLYGDLAAPQ